MRAFTLHGAMLEAAERRPDAPAVRHGGDELSYGRLAEGSSSVARLLAELGVRRGDRVALHLPKSVAAVEALYAILSAGASYVPIDPSAPAPRLAAILEQCRPRALVTWGAAGSRLSSETCAAAGLEAIVSVDEVGQLAGLPVELRTRADADGLEPLTGVPVVDEDLAYVLFTSGSTGTPKGVMLTHRNALTFVDWAVAAFDLRPEDRLSNHAPFTFDLSVLDLFGAARAGACVSLVPEGSGMFPSRLADLIERERISVWYSVPSVLTLLVERGGLGKRQLDALRWVLFAGEVFPVRYLRTLMQAVPGARFANLYGPTETNVVTWHEVTEPPEEDAPPVPIGRACANSDCIALTPDGRRVERPGEEGILHVRGGTVMQGYFGRAEESPACFVDNPFADGRPERLYCTGDWVTLDEDGNYLYLGRRDHMVKTGGYRVELGEIETALFAHPGVRDAVALAVPDDVLGARIEAVVVGDGLSEHEVRQHCAARLPRYMVPAAIALRETLPRTPNDKVDRARLLREATGANGRGDA